MDPGPAELPTAPLTLAWVNRASPGIPSLNGDRQGAEGGTVVHTVSCAVVPAGTLVTLFRRVPRSQSAAPRVRPFRSRGEPIYRESETPRGRLTKKNLTQVRQIFPLKGSNADI